MEPCCHSDITITNSALSWESEVKKSLDPFGLPVCKKFSFGVLGLLFFSYIAEHFPILTSALPQSNCYIPNVIHNEVFFAFPLETISQLHPSNFSAPDSSPCHTSHQMMWTHLRLRKPVSLVIFMHEQVCVKKQQCYPCDRIHTCLKKAVPV